jgi:hypothetical protein
MNERIEKIKQHFKDNKNVYTIGGICLVVGGVAGVLSSTKSVQVVDNFNIKYKSPTSNVVEVTMIRPGPKSFVVQCLETQKTWPSLRSAAKDLGINPGELSKHLKGEVGSIDGKDFTKLAEV